MGAFCLAEIDSVLDWICLGQIELDPTGVSPVPLRVGSAELGSTLLDYDQRRLAILG